MSVCKVEREGEKVMRSNVRGCLLLVSYIS